MRRNFFCALFLCASMQVLAQFNESFADGNFSVDPIWGGYTAHWQVVASSDVAAGAANSNTLRLNVPTGSGVSWLSTQVNGNWGIAQSWALFIGRRGQAYTAANHTCIWLWCSQPDLSSATASGYRIRIGDDAGGDEIILQRVVNGISTDILTGTALNNGLNDIGFLLRVTRSKLGVWELFTSMLPAVNGAGSIATDVPGELNTGVVHGSATDNTYTAFNNGYFGFVAAYGSGAAARAAQEFDQVRLSFTQEGLPVKLTQFQAVKTAGFVQLSWNVTGEWGLLQYEAERSNDGARFTTIGTVKACNKRQYYFTDAYSDNGNSIYRLRMVDIDGKYAYSPLVIIRNSAPVSLRTYPNPLHNIITVEHPSTTERSNLRIRDATGKLVRQVIIHPKTSRTSLNLSALPNGLYHITFINKKIQLHATTIKQAPN